MVNTTKRIVIARPLLDLLRRDTNLKAVYDPLNTGEQRIDLLVSPEYRVLELEPADVEMCDDDFQQTALVKINNNDIAHIKVLQKIIKEQNKDCDIVHIAVRTGAGKVDFDPYNAGNAVYQKMVHIYENHITYLGELVRGGVVDQQPATIDMDDLISNHQKGSLLSFDELSDPCLNVFILSGDGQVAPNQDTDN